MIAYTPPVVPITTSCIMNASITYQVPLPILVSVLAQEAGKIGQTRLNTNNTRDHGPMQINTIWLSDISKYGVTAEQVTNNGCLNVIIGAAILRQRAKEAKGDWWKAVGEYHSRTPSKRDAYLTQVVIKMQRIMTGKITLAAVLNRANKVSLPNNDKPKK
jgi:hypothetical protein